jgi:nucleoside-diphosphate-sugar epimerase
MRCLLFGAGGFLGGHVLTLLAEDPAATVIPAGRGGAGATSVVSAPAAGGVRVDLATAGPGELVSLLWETTPDVVVNCAGSTNGDAGAMARSNVVAVANLIAALDGYHRPVRLVHLGSAAEYGAVPAGRPVPETFPAQPVSAYGMSKLAGTELVLAARRRGRSATVLRVFNPVGPGTPGTLLPGRLVEALRRSAESGERARLGRLDGHRDFVDARDVATAVRAAALAEGPLPALFNVGSGQATGLRELAALAAETVGVPPPLEDENAGGSQRSAAVSWQQADIGAAVTALGWQPAYSLAASLRDMGLPAAEASVPAR